MRLVIVAEYTDRQSADWSALARTLDCEVHHLTLRELGKKWIVSAVGPRPIRVVIADYGDIEISRPDTAWYLRLPSLAGHPHAAAVMELHLWLAHIAFPARRYPLPAGIEGTYEPKPLHAKLRGEALFPACIITEAGLNPRPSQRLVAKSVSTERSTVVRLDDPRLSNGSSIRRGPVVIQERVEGTNIKVHAYRSSRGEWMILAVAASSRVTDYREDEATSFYQVEDPFFSKMADAIYRLTGAWWFDFDLIDTGRELFFLEANWSPAPRFYETKLFGGVPRYSAKVMADWLSELR